MSFVPSTTLRSIPRFARFARMCSNTPGDSGGQGSIRQAGGSFAKMEMAHEEEFFYKQRQQQLAQLKQKAVDEQTFREESIKQHEEAIERHVKALADLKKKK